MPELHQGAFYICELVAIVEGTLLRYTRGTAKI